jgi:hypothetical protein
MGPNAGPRPNYSTVDPFSLGSSYPLAGPNTGPQQIMGPSPYSTQDPFTMRSSYPTLPNGSPDQLAALQRLNKFSGGVLPGSNALEAKWNNVFPDAPDNSYLQGLFPEVFNQNPSIYHAWKQLFEMSQQPQYVNQFGL